MKVCITGKGGVGKTTIAALTARILARSGPVLAVDADPNPNLALVLGLGSEQAAAIRSVANEVLEHRRHHADHHAGTEVEDPDIEELVRQLAIDGPDGIQLVQAGRIERPAAGCLCCGSHRTTRRLFGELESDDRFVVVDLEAGVNDLVWAMPGRGDTVIIVTELYRKSLEVAKDALHVCAELEVGDVLVVVNRTAPGDDIAAVLDVLPGPDVASVPDDPAIAAAAATGRSPMDDAPDSPAVAAVGRLAGHLMARSQAFSTYPVPRTV